ncbi:MAG: hypothetical protein FWG10_03405 [Eubacteriaceae bacterium]|nr:hypothetical protein [Eubacteriaceae bacterium]
MDIAFQLPALSNYPLLAACATMSSKDDCMPLRSGRTLFTGSKQDPIRISTAPSSTVNEMSISPLRSFYSFVGNRMDVFFAKLAQLDSFIDTADKPALQFLCVFLWLAGCHPRPLQLRQTPTRPSSDYAGAKINIAPSVFAAAYCHTKKLPSLANLPLPYFTIYL